MLVLKNAVFEVLSHPLTSSIMEEEGVRCLLHTELPPLPFTLASLFETMTSERGG